MCDSGTDQGGREVEVAGWIGSRERRGAKPHRGGGGAAVAERSGASVAQGGAAARPMTECSVIGSGPADLPVRAGHSAASDNDLFCQTGAPPV